MEKVADLPANQRQELFSETAAQKGVLPRKAVPGLAWRIGGKKR